MTTYGLSLGLVLLGAVFFDRFDSSKTWPHAKKESASDSLEPAVLSLSKGAAVISSESQPKVQLSPLPASGSRFRFGTLYLAELRMLLKGQPWWWYLGALGLIGASLLAPFESLRTYILPFSLIWPTLLWSGLGCRENQHFTRQMVFAAPRPLRDQLPAAWLAGLTVAALMGAGSAARFIMAGELSSLSALLAGLLFIPSLALALGVWTGSSKAFEVIYVLFWYLGLLNKVLELDYIGIHSTDYQVVYLFLSAALVLLAFIGRNRQLQIT
jgi:hypothetical protein